MEQIQPVIYHVDLTLDPQRDTFRGSINIRLEVRKPAPILWLNAANISVQKVSVNRSGRVLTPATVPGGGQDFIGFKFESPLPVGAAEIQIHYTGKFQLQGQSGIFRSEDAGSRYLLTQFEWTDARKAFPCFDEPSYKVPWQVTLHVPAQEKVIGNTPVASQFALGQTATYVFKETKPLPSYLVAFGMGPFEFVD